MSSWLSRLRCAAAAGSRSLVGHAEEPAAARAASTKARTTSRSAASGQATASNTAVVVTPPRGAQTSAHQRPSVARPSSTPWWRHSCASRSTGVAAHADPAIRARGRVPGRADQPEQPHRRPASSPGVHVRSPGSTSANDGRDRRCRARALDRQSVSPRPSARRSSPQPSRSRSTYSIQPRCPRRRRPARRRGRGAAGRARPCRAGRASARSRAAPAGLRNGPVTSTRLSQSRCC